MNASVKSGESVGAPVDRVDGRAKVMGTARYAAEFEIKDLVFVVTAESTITKGKIKSLRTDAAKTAPGVLAVITHENAFKLHPPAMGSPAAKPGEKSLPLQDTKISYDGQVIAMVVATTLEEATHAASLISADYEQETPSVELEKTLSKAKAPQLQNGEHLQRSRGDAEGVLLRRKDGVVVTGTYVTPIEHHNPMEPHSSIAAWDHNTLTVYVSTQAVMGNRQVLSSLFAVDPGQVHIISPFVGGGFGSKGATWMDPILAAMAAKHVGRPCKLMKRRQQMFTSNGYRPRTIQTLSLGATADGHIYALVHETTANNSEVGDFVETCGLVSSMLYAAPNLKVSHKVVPLNMGAPTYMRAPGEASGTFALEAAMDELAFALKMDPLQLRLINHADQDPHAKLPFSSKRLKECYARGAEAFGWSKRTAEPRSMRDGRYLIGYGMATATYPAHRGTAQAKAEIFSDGSIVFSSATQDIGTGSYTIFTQIAADALGVSVDRVQFKLGDSLYPVAPGSGGSTTAATVGPAVRAAGEALRTKLIALAVDDAESPLYGLEPLKLTVVDGRIVSQGDDTKGESYLDVLKRKKLAVLEAAGTGKPAGMSEAPGTRDKPTKDDSHPPLADKNWDTSTYSFHSFGAHFVEVQVDPDFGEVRLRRVVSVMDVGRVLNMKTATSQIQGGIIFSAGMALMEETVVDPGGRIVTKNLADYLVPVNADIPQIDVSFINEPDPHMSVIGARGIGEIGNTGMAAAISNAVFHATGKRVRDLPITPDKLIA